MMIDVTRFTLLNVLDTCAAWNLLSSRILYEATRHSGCHLCCTDFVRYEALHKPRTREHAGDAQLQQRFRRAVDSGEVSVHAIALEELQEVELLRNRRRLSFGEISAMAFAKRTNQALLTDDQGARRLANEHLGNGRAQTTPHLLGWLLFSSQLSESSTIDVISEHVALGGVLTPHFRAAAAEAARCLRLAEGQRQDS